MFEESPSIVWKGAGIRRGWCLAWWEKGLGRRARSV